MPNRTFPELIGDLDKLSTNLRGRLAEVPHLSPLQADLEAWLIEARASESQQGVYTARLREVNEQRRGIETRGVVLKTRVVDNLRGHFGGQADAARVRRPPAARRRLPPPGHPAAAAARAGPAAAAGPGAAGEHRTGELRNRE